MPPSSDSTNIFILGRASMDSSVSSSSLQHISDELEHQAATSPWDTDCSDTTPVAEGWLRLWEPTDQSSIESATPLQSGPAHGAHGTDSSTTGDSHTTLEEQLPVSPMDHTPSDHDGALRAFGNRIRNLWDVMNRKDSTSQTITPIREDLHAISRQIEEWLVASAMFSKPPQGNAQDIERYQSTIHALELENMSLSDRSSSLVKELQNAKSAAEVWKAEARNVQNMQEIAVNAFERCNTLEIENTQLKQAMHAFAEGSTNNTVKELRRIIGDLTHEIAHYKRREAALQTRETQMRNKENANIIEHMRKQTQELKQRRPQRKVLQDSNGC